MSHDSSHPILIIEDNDFDYESTVRAFQKSHLANPIYRCTTSNDALDFLFRRGKFAPPADAPRPSIILLDLKLAQGTDGHEVLQTVKRDAGLKTIPIIVLTSSDDEYDIQDCYGMGANSYISKPVTFEGYMDAVKRLEQYWFHIVILPDEWHAPKA
jgi:two-component system response regulator